MKSIPNVCKKKWCIPFTILLLLSALLYSLIEIEIEGKNGWGKQLPTANIGKSKKSLTMYHVYMGLFIITILSIVFLVNKPFNIKNLLYMISMSLWFFILEDMYWFMFNPNYKFQDAFTAKWHSKVGTIPIIYLVLPIISIICGLLSYKKSYGLSMIVIIVGSVLLYPLSLAYKPFYKMFKNRKTNCKCS